MYDSGRNYAENNSLAKKYGNRLTFWSELLGPGLNKFKTRKAIRYDTRCYFNVRSKADIPVSQLNLPHGTDN